MALTVVTGAAGFIGSQLCLRLLEAGHTVRGVDNFDPYYPRLHKEAHLAPLAGRSGFTFREADLTEMDLDELLTDVEWVFHQAARPGVRASWGEDFAVYLRANLLATQRLCEAARHRPLRRFVFASSSSVYGEGAGSAASEETPRRPVSPYGVTKSACEELLAAYHVNYGLPVVSLRYFTVFGPGQRPDMAFHRFVRAFALGQPLEVFGDGRQSRDFTFVADAVIANLQAAERGRPGTTYNIGGGAPASVLDVVAMLEAVTGRKAQILWGPRPPGDPRATMADTTRARAELGYAPSVGLEEGLRRMWAWMSAWVAGEGGRGR